jgi:2-(1,2-epoxy-1,2-dihydrophenyl)acetyl-CoA isomerase
VTTQVPRVAVNGGVATVLLDRPEAGNALDLATATALRDAVHRLAAEDLGVVVLRAAGRMFCAGGDVRAMASVPASEREPGVAELATTVHEALVGLRALPVPVVAAVQGPVAGGGLGLVLAADIVVASDRATFVAAYSAVGLSPDCGVSALLPSVVGPRRAALFTLTGVTLDAATALEWGLVSEVCAHADLDERVGEVAGAIAALPRAAARETARLLRGSGERTYSDQLADEAATIARLSTTPDADALIRAFAAPRPAPSPPTPATNGDPQ